MNYDHHGIHLLGHTLGDYQWGASRPNQPFQGARARGPAFTLSFSDMC